MRILIIEDDPDIASNLYDFLEAAGHTVDAAPDGITGLHLASSGQFDCILLDLGLPRLDGNTLCRRLREDAHVETPVLMITARDTLDDKLKGFEHGADDYLVKPFSISELLARMRVSLRHRGTTVHAAQTVYEQQQLRVDLNKYEVHKGGQAVRLTPTEFKLLARLVRQAGQVVTHRQLLWDVWGAEYIQHTHYLRLYMAQLRAKLEDNPTEPKLLLTEPGVGYRLFDEA